MNFEISSSAFPSGGSIPSQYTCSGKDVPPPLAWTGVPSGATSLALICEDPDAPGGTFYHWGLYDLPANLMELSAGLLPNSSKLVRNGFGVAAYRGPCPPRGHGTHHYHFQIFALSRPHLEVPPGADCRALLAAMRPHVLGSAEVVGTFSR